MTSRRRVAAERTGEKFRVWFWNQTECKLSGCREWMRCRTSGFCYGKLSYGGVVTHAHRVAWILSRGPIPDGLWVLHRCDNPPCVEPAHLFLGTQTTNMRDAVNKGRLVLPHFDATGIVRSATTRARISAARRGRVSYIPTEEQRRAKSDILKAYYAAHPRQRRQANGR